MSSVESPAIILYTMISIACARPERCSGPLAQACCIFFSIISTVLSSKATVPSTLLFFFFCVFFLMGALTVALLPLVQLFVSIKGNSSWNLICRLKSTL